MRTLLPAACPTRAALCALWLAFNSAWLASPAWASESRPLTAAPPSWATATPVRLTLDEAVAAALRHARQLPANEAQATASRELAVAAGQRPDPVLRLSLDNLPVNGSEAWSTTRDFMTMRSVGVMQTLPSQAKRTARAARLHAHSHATQQATGSLQSDIQRATALAWLEAHAAGQRMALLHQQLEQAGREEVATQAALRSGQAVQADWLDARDRSWQIEQQLATRRAEEAAALDALARWTGVAALPEPAEPDTTRQTPAVAALLAQHPELAVLQARLHEAEATAELARLERDPDWSVEVMLSQRGPQYSDMLTLGVSLPLPWNRTQRQDRQLAAALAQSEALSHTLEEARRAQALQLQEWLHAERAARERLAIIDTHRLPLAQQRVEAVLGSYRSSNARLATVLAARQQLLALQLERIEVELEGARLRASLAYLLPRGAQPAPTLETRP
jgi:outer membrane protein, heavy metal efflux system